MNINKKINAKCKEIWEAMMAEAEMQGLTFYEVRHNRRGKYDEKFIGVEAVKLDRLHSGRDGFDNYRVRIVKDGVFEMQPDGSGVRWGYLLNTDSNREWLSAQQADGLLYCADQKIINKAKFIQSNRKRPVEDRNMRNYLDNIKKRSGELPEKVDEAAELKKQLEELKSQMLALTTSALAAKTEEPVVEEKAEPEEKKTTSRRTTTKK